MTQLRLRSRWGRLVWLWLVCASAWVPLGAQAQPTENRPVQNQIEFTQVELDAARVLLKPELNAVELNGQKGIYYPAPAILALGVEPLEFDLDFRGLSELANIQFNGLKASSPQIQFMGSHLILQVPLADRSRVAQSRLGSISIQGVQLTARLAWRDRPSGQRELVIVSTAVSGKWSGTGFFKPNFMIDLVKKLLCRTLEQFVTRLLTRAEVTDGIEQGLLGWAKFSTGRAARAIMPHTIEFFETPTRKGLRYRVE